METLKKWLPINFDLVANPYNWVIVVLMLMVAGLALAFVFPSANEVKDNEG